MIRKSLSQDEPTGSVREQSPEITDLEDEYLALLDRLAHLEIDEPPAPESNPPASWCSDQSSKEVSSMTYRGSNPWPSDEPKRSGVVESFDKKRLFGFILGDDRSRYFFHLHDVQLDSLLHQRSTCIPSTPVQFRNVRKTTKPFSDLNRRLRDPHAGEVSLIDDPVVDLETHRETSFVRDWYPDRHVGFLMRQSGDELGFLERHIISVPEAISTLQRGSLIYHGVSRRWRSEERNATDAERKATRPSWFERTDARKMVEVTDVEIYDQPPITFDKWQESFSPVEIEVAEIPKPTEEETEEESYSSPLLTRFSNVPLRRIGIRRVA
jgi:hypothetical protein